MCVYFRLSERSAYAYYIDVSIVNDSYKRVVLI